MSAHFEILAHHPTPIGDLVLRRRRPPGTEEDWIHEILLAGDFLMSSLVRDSEEALSEIALATHDGHSLDVLVGGLGLGYTAAAALQNPRVHFLTIVELLSPVISWHQDNQLPLGRVLVDDPRCRIESGDFFEWIETTESTHDMILVDIDHSPESLLATENHTFYETDAIRSLHDRLRPCGLFGLWSATPLQSDYLRSLQSIFADVRTQTIAFHNPHIGEEDNNTILIARKS